MKTNVDLLKIIQLGFSLCDVTGKAPPRTWQFNFHFDLRSVAACHPACLLVVQLCYLRAPGPTNAAYARVASTDIYAESSISFLRKHGIDFDRHQREGIDVQWFASLLYPSGIVCSDDLTW